MIVVIGDSITYGQHLRDRNWAWPNLLRTQEIVEAVGIPGDTTRLGLERFPKDVQEKKPNKVIIQFGHNDCNRWQTDLGLPRVSQRAFQANLEEMIDRCMAFGAEPYLCTITPSLRNDQHAEDVEIYDGIVREVAEYGPATLIDVRAAFTHDYYLMDDGLHLSESGHKAYAAVVQTVL